MNIKITRKYCKSYFHTIRVTPKHLYLYKHFHEITFPNVCTPIFTSPLECWNKCAFSSLRPIYPSRFLADLHSWNDRQHILQSSSSCKIHLFQKLPDLRDVQKKPLYLRTGLLESRINSSFESIIKGTTIHHVSVAPSQYHSSTKAHHIFVLLVPQAIYEILNSAFYSHSPWWTTPRNHYPSVPPTAAFLKSSETCLTN